MEDLNALPKRAQQVCKDMEISNIPQILEKTEMDFLRSPKCTKKVLHQIKIFLAEKGYMIRRRD
jgi:hypothetical protein